MLKHWCKTNCENHLTLFFLCRSQVYSQYVLTFQVDCLRFNEWIWVQFNFGLNIHYQYLCCHGCFECEWPSTILKQFFCLVVCYLQPIYQSVSLMPCPLTGIFLKGAATAEVSPTFSVLALSLAHSLPHLPFFFASMLAHSFHWRYSPDSPYHILFTVFTKSSHHMFSPSQTTMLHPFSHSTSTLLFHSYQASYTYFHYFLYPILTHDMYFI